MFEHMKNYQVLLAKVSTWLKPKAKRVNEADDAYLFIHIFCHRTTPYHFEEDDGWMAKNFFSGMPTFSSPCLCHRLIYLARWHNAIPRLNGMFSSI